MPRKSQKQQIINFLIKRTELAIKFAEDVDSDPDEAIDEIMDEFMEDLTCTLKHRRGVQNTITKQVNGRDDILSSIDDDRFREMFRVDRYEFSHLLEIIENDRDFELSHTREHFPIETQLAIMLYRLGCMGENASVRRVAAVFGVGDGGTLDKITQRLFEIFLRAFSKYVYWPNSEERAKIVEKTFNELPYCIGYVDCFEVSLIETPITNPKLFFSQTHKYSVKLQIICDHKHRIRDVVVGNPGSYDDAKIFRRCNIYKRKDKYFTDQQYLAGDTAYPLSDILITPYRRNSSHLDLQKRMQFNKRHSKYRSRVENCIDMLKERFCSLNEVRFRMRDHKSQKNCSQWILVCCLLHNILLNEEEICDYGAKPPKVDEEELNNPNTFSNEDEDGSFEIKRQSLCDLMFDKK